MFLKVLKTKIHTWADLHVPFSVGFDLKWLLKTSITCTLHLVSIFSI